MKRNKMRRRFGIPRSLHRSNQLLSNTRISNPRKRREIEENLLLNSAINQTRERSEFFFPQNLETPSPPPPLSLSPDDRLD